MYGKQKTKFNKYTFKQSLQKETKSQNYRVHNGVKDLKVHTARRSKVSFSFKVNSSKLHADKQQIEIDGIFETKSGMIVTVEAKNVEHEDFEIRQLFSIKKYFDIMDNEDINSIKFIQVVQYNINMKTK